MYRDFENLFNGSCVYKTLAGISDDINSVLTRRWTLFAQMEKPRLEKPNSSFRFMYKIMNFYSVSNLHINSRVNISSKYRLKCFCAHFQLIIYT
jgi:hypothetical protein